jgi:hypothetical protein
MKTGNLIVKGLFAFALCGMILTGCKKEEVTADDTTDATDHSTSEQIANDVDNVADAGLRDETSSFRGHKDSEDIEILSVCATITHDSVSTPGSIVTTIDFGTVNCLCKDGQNRRGKVIITHTGKYKDAGSVRTITFNGYYVNDVSVAGTRTVTNKGQNSAGNYTWSISANMTLTFTDGTTHKWTSTRTREITAGYSTPQLKDDVYSITGSYSGTRRSGDTYSASILTALVRDLSCKQFVSGVIEMTDTAKNPKNKVVKRSVDYGTGSCDGVAMLTVTFKNGKTKTKQIKAD